MGETVKVLGLFGSPRRGGNTEILLEEALKGAEKEGAKVERLYLSDFTITPCKECHGCDRTGNCVILDDMQKIYPKFLETDVVILASPIFFYGVTAWAKALIDRSQALWARKYLLKDPSLGKEGKRRKGFFISVGATKGLKVFDGAILTVKYFFDVLNAEYVGELVFRGVEAKGDILKHLEALQQAFEAGRRLVSDLKRGGMKIEPGILKRMKKLVQKEGSMRKTLVISGLILASLFLVGAKYDFLLEMGDKMVKSSECNECHKLIYEEWATKDFHSKAFVSDAFRKGSKNYGAEECIACHAAQEIAEEKNLKIRPVHKEEGVNCTTCHLKNNMIYGSYKLTAKHKSEQDESMLKSEFCSGCHMPTFQEWQASGSKRTCQECHMPRVERKAVQGFPISMFVPNRMVGQHTQSYEKLLKEAALITGEAGKGSLKISLTNRAGGHNMPTGKYGDYRIVLNTQVKDTDGKTIFSKEESFSTLKKNGVPPQKAVTFEYPISLETGKRYKVNSTLLYQVEGRPEQSVVIWNAEIEGGK